MHLEKFTFHPEQQQWVNCRGADLSLSLEQLRDGYSLTAIKEKKVYRYDVTTAKDAAQYDSNDNKIRIIYPDQSIERIFYDPMGNILKKVQPMDYDAKRDDGPGYTYEYDEVNRLVQITAPDGTVEKRYVYDLCGNIVKLIDAAGYLTGKTDAERIGSLYTYNYGRLADRGTQAASTMQTASRSTS